LGIALNKNTSL